MKSKENNRFWSFSRTDDVAELYIYGSIGDNFGETSITEKEFLEDLKKIENCSKIDLHINSQGGSVTTATAINSLLVKSGKLIDVYIDGLAASMASVLAMLGKSIYMPSNTMMMIHNPWSGIYGNADELRKEAKILDKIKETMIDSYAAKSKLSREEISKIMDEETWLTAQEAFELGFCTDVTAPLNIYASIDNSNLNLNGITIEQSRYKNFKMEYIENFRNMDIADKAGAKQPEEQYILNKKFVNQKNRKDKKTMDLNLLCTKVALNYDSLVEEGKTTEEIYSLALSKINNDNENKQKIKAMLSLGEQYGAVDKAVEFIKNGKDLEAFKTELLDMQAKKALNANGKYGQIGIETKEARNFSFSRLINAVVNPNDRTAQNAAAFEFEACNEAAKKYGRTQSENGNGLRIPFEALSAPLVGRNASNELTTTDGDALIQTTLLSSSFIELLRNKCYALQLGYPIPGLQGNLSIPKQTAGASGYWVGEKEAPTVSKAGFATVDFAMKTVGGLSYVTRQMVKQSSIGIEALIRNDLATALALAIDKAVFYGAAANNKEPKGLKNITGVNVVEFAGENPTFGELVDMETKIAIANADVSNMHYIVNPAMRGYAKQTLKFTNSTNAGGTIWEPGNTLNGYSAYVTNQITAGDVFFGNFSDLLIGMWGGIELLVNPYAESKQRLIEITAFQDIDINVRNAQSFCYGAKKSST